MLPCYDIANVYAIFILFLLLLTLSMCLMNKAALIKNNNNNNFVLDGLGTRGTFMSNTQFNLFF